MEVYMRYWKVPMFLFVLVTGGSATYAQRVQLSAEERATRLKDSLSLSDEQTAAVVKIYQEVDQKRQDLFNSTSGDRQERMNAMRGLAEQTDQKIRALLTSDQKTKYDDMRKHRQERGQGSRRRQDG